MTPKTQHRMIRMSTIFCMIAIPLGCEPAPEIRVATNNIDSLGLVNTSESVQYRWPVVAGKWEVSRPTGFTFLRRMKPGELGKIADQIDRDRQAKIELAKQSDQPAPWTIASTDVDEKTARYMAVAIGEIAPELEKKLTVEFPASVRSAEVRLDITGKHLFLLDDGIWVSKLPWREWWTTETTPAQETDITGSPNDFQRIGLDANEDNADGESAKVKVAFFRDPSRLFATKGNTLSLIDFEKREILTSLKTAIPIRHLSVSFQTGRPMVVDQEGGIYLANVDLDRMDKIGECDVQLPMPQISLDATRIVTLQSPSLGRVFKLDDLGVIDEIDIPISGATDLTAIGCTRAYDYWIGKDIVITRPEYPNSEDADQKGWPMTLYWDFEQVFETRNDTDSSESQFCIAERTTANGSRERVCMDMSFGDRMSFRPSPVPGDKSDRIVASQNGGRIALVNDTTIELYDREIQVPQSVAAIGKLAKWYAWENRFDDLEMLHRVLRQLPETRFNRTPEQLYEAMLTAIASQWLYTLQQTTQQSLNEEQRTLAKERLDGFVNWSKTKTPLALCAAMSYHRKLAWAARGNGWSSDVTQSGWDDFEKHNKIAINLWNEISTLDDIPAVAYYDYFLLARDTGIEMEQVAEPLETCLRKYPRESLIHPPLMQWMLEKWGGTRGSGPAYIHAVADAVGSATGDWLYERSIESIQNSFGYAFFEYSQVNGSRVLRGVEEGIRSNYWQHNSALTAMYLVEQSHSRLNSPPAHSPYSIQAKATCESLAEYYRQRYPMLSNLGVSDRYRAAVTRYLER
ncbi:hypothetical protein CA13_50390 [Planctomycetes bacterium CA13]|uniref:Uncharacterized protein n=1 Tax=Novipirellula herctigrandis TaxID=2527986 RepID=A0A5C5ZAM0_9BACT|nr:hypothetical protein CA13_50390 [Planctomycetes bacterium CA13]